MTTIRLSLSFNVSLFPSSFLRDSAGREEQEEEIIERERERELRKRFGLNGRESEGEKRKDSFSRQRRTLIYALWYNYSGDEISQISRLTDLRLGGTRKLVNMFL